MDDAIRAWFGRLGEPRRSQAEDLAKIVAGADPRLQQAVKWGRLTFTTADNWHHWLCAIAAPAKGAKLIFHKGALLDDPDQLLTGSARYVRELPAEPALRHPTAVAALVTSAITHQTDMLE